ncbi:transposase, Ptta/En/Spm [Tanacetum coccineum]
MPSRKAKRARVRARTCNDNQQVEDVLQMGSNHLDGDEVQVIQRKRVRGPTFMPKVWTKSEEDRISVSFNEYGQPIDKKTTSTLTHFMGSLARSGKYCPLHKPWPKVGSSKKRTLLDVLNDKFDLPMGCDDWILKSFGKKRVSEKNKANREKKKMVQVTGKKSYAIVREEVKESLGGREPTRRELFRACFSTDGIAKNEEAANAIDKMEELSSQLPEGATDEPGPQDVYSKVMGKDNNGPADLYGLGVRASDVWGVVPSHAARRRDKLMYKSRCDQLSCELAELKARDSQRRSSENASVDTNVVNEPQPLRFIIAVIMESHVKKKKKGAILELKRRHLKNTIFCTYAPYPAMKIRRISASSAQETRNDQFPIWRIHYNQYAVCTAVHQSKIRI